MGPAEERGTIIRRPAERALQVTASLPRKGWLCQRNPEHFREKPGTDEQPQRDAQVGTV